jgi:ABC-type spermidine/putrescine transport system permease subunit II
MESLRKFKRNEAANVDMILTAIIAGVMFAVAIPIVYSVLGGIDYVTVDGNFGGVTTSPSQNASNNTMSALATFFTIGPIYLIVIAAVGIIAAILLLRGR